MLEQKTMQFSSKQGENLGIPCPEYKCLCPKSFGGLAMVQKLPEKLFPTKRLGSTAMINLSLLDILEYWTK